MSPAVKDLLYKTMSVTFTNTLPRDGNQRYYDSYWPDAVAHLSPRGGDIALGITKQGFEHAMPLIVIEKGDINTCQVDPETSLITIGMKKDGRRYELTLGDATLTPVVVAALAPVMVVQEHDETLLS